MKFKLIILGLLFGLTACGGGSTGGESSDTGSGDLGPIVDAGGDFGAGSDTGGGGERLCNPDTNITLEITEIENDHNSSLLDLEQQLDLDDPLVVYTGDTHQYGFPEPTELQTRIQFEVSSSEGNLVVPFDIRIAFGFLTDSDVEETFFLGCANGFSFFGDNTDCTDETKQLPAIFDDSVFPGYFDFTGLPPGLDWNDQLVVAQVCDQEVEVPGEGIVEVSSNPIYFIIRPGIEVP